MTIAFFCVFLAFCLNLLSKAPVAIAQNARPEHYDNRHPRDQQAQLRGWGRRALAAHLNSFEAFPSFAAAVIIAALAGADPLWTTRLAMTFVSCRVLYIAFYITDLHILRSTVWTLGFGATAAIFLLPFRG